MTALVTKGLWSQHSPVSGTEEVCPALFVGAALLGGEAEVVGDGAAVIDAWQGDALEIAAKLATLLYTK